MTGSELEQRISDITYGKGNSGSIGIAVVHAEDLAKILGKAKKEFPMLTKENEQKWGENWMDELLSARSKWFRKWFGEDSQP